MAETSRQTASYGGHRSSCTPDTSRTPAKCQLGGVQECRDGCQDQQPVSIPVWPESQLHSNPTECQQHTVGAASSFLRVGGLLLRSAAVHMNEKGTDGS